MECFSFSFDAMGSRCGVHLFTEAYSEALVAAESVIKEVKRIERLYSRYIDESETSRINRAANAGTPIVVGPETARLLTMAFRFHRMSNGLFDITSGIFRKVWNFSSKEVPSENQVKALLPFVGMHNLILQGHTLQFKIAGMELDFGGIAKEYASDMAAQICRTMGEKHCLVDLGGDIAVVGPLPNGAPWKIHIRHPRIPNNSLAILDVSKGGVATSGDYERFIDANGKRFCHILNPKTGFPTQGIASVTVVASSCRLAGGLSTSAMLQGDNAPGWLIKTNRPHAWILADGKSGGTLLQKITKPLNYLSLL